MEWGHDNNYSSILNQGGERVLSRKQGLSVTRTFFFGRLFSRDVDCVCFKSVV